MLIFPLPIAEVDAAMLLLEQIAEVDVVALMLVTLPHLLRQLRQLLLGLIAEAPMVVHTPASPLSLLLLLAEVAVEAVVGLAVLPAETAAVSVAILCSAAVSSQSELEEATVAAATIR